MLRKKNVKWMEKLQKHEKKDHDLEESEKIIIILSIQLDLGGYRWPPAYSTWNPIIVSFCFLVTLIVAQFTIFRIFSGPQLSEPF
jgi:hypothetical protein